MCMQVNLADPVAAASHKKLSTEVVKSTEEGTQQPTYTYMPQSIKGKSSHHWVSNLCI